MCGLSNVSITNDLENDLQGHFMLFATRTPCRRTFVSIHRGGPRLCRCAGWVVPGVIDNTGGSWIWW